MPVSQVNDLNRNPFLETRNVDQNLLLIFSFEN